jgi:hypothetical protein
MSLDERLARLKEVYRGWINAFKYASMQNKLIQLDGWLRNRIRYCIWHHWKKPNKKMRSLIRLGINPSMAYAWSRSRLGGWAIAQSPILGTTITVSRLRNRGYESLLEYYQSVSPVFTQYPLEKAGILTF